MKLIIIIILLLQSGVTLSETRMYPAPPNYFERKELTNDSALENGLAFALRAINSYECALRVNVIETHSSKKIRLSVTHRNENINTLRVEQPASTGNIFGSIIFSKGYIDGGYAQIEMFKSGNVKVFHGIIRLNELGGCGF